MARKTNSKKYISNKFGSAEIRRIQRILIKGLIKVADYSQKRI